MKKILLMLSLVSVGFACGNRDHKQTANNATHSAQPDPAGPESAGSGAGAESVAGEKAQNREPKTVRDFFMLLPEKYFVLEGCDRDKDKECKRAREDYLETFGEVVDIQNGYVKGGCDGGQACIEMAIFKRPDGKYLIGVATFAEMMNSNYFLDYNNGEWTDVSSTALPEFSKKFMYELPRIGTVVKVFEKKIIEQGDDFEASEKGKKLYDLKWQDGKFATVR